MELLELKSIWDIVVEDTISKERVDEFLVEKSIKKDSKSVLAKIRGVMYVKFLIGGIFLIIFLLMLLGSILKPVKYGLYSAIFDVTEYRIFLCTGIFFLMGTLSWNIRAFRQIRHFERNSSSIKESLGRFIRIMNKTIKFNVYFSAAFDSIVFGWICYLLNRKIGLVEGSIQVAVLVLLAAILGAFVFFSLARFKQKVKFGNYLDKLKLAGKRREMERWLKVTEYYTAASG